MGGLGNWIRKPITRHGAILLVVAAWISAAWPEDSPGREAAPASEFQWQGSISCAAAACHNAYGPPGYKGSEYTIWATQDRHRQAFTVLLNKQSRRIEENLRGGKVKACEDKLCLGCHVHPQAAEQQAHIPLSDGVGCESCHGPAEKWKAVHYLPGWKEKSAAEKQQLGMVPTKDLLVRAQLCASCHVGSGERDVNHDLIAAGHPRLNFEFSAFSSIMPRHWSVREEKARYPDFEARAWALGQVVSAQAALELLAYRAETKHQAPWPEFAEYNCFACHHDLQAQGWRRPRDQGRGPKAAGTLEWGTWHYSLLPQALEPRADPATTKLLAELRKEMDKPNPSRDKVARIAADGATGLTPWVKRFENRCFDDPALLQGLFSEIARDERNLSRAHWDGAAQLYLALAALYHAQGDLDPDQRDPELKRPLMTLRQQLEFPTSLPRYDSPDEVRYRARESQFQKALETIRKRTER